MILYFNSGYTNNLTRRIWEHKSRLIEGFSKKYNVDKLVYFESFNNSIDAMHREKQIKAGSRKKKIELINKFNPEWRDLYNFNILYE